jgi:hypothetical protein
MLLLLAIAASAQTFSVYDDAMIEPTVGTWYEAGAGSPTVVYRRASDDYVMFFESRLAPPDTVCKQGYWGVGVAVSDDGRTWTVDSQPLLEPTDGTFRRCVVAHPYAVVDDGGADIHLWFKAEQPRKACQGLATPHPWGCNQYTGVGYVKVGADLQTILEAPTTPVVDPAQTFGYPAVTRVDDTWYMMLARRPDMYLATSDRPDGGWVLDRTPVMQPGVTTWANDELFNPALVCDESSATYPFRAYFGGRNWVNGTIDSGGWGDAISSDAVTWLVNAAPFFDFEPSPELAWRHWDAVKAGSDTLIYFSDKDASGKNRIGFAGTTDTWHDWRVESRLCPQPAGWYEVTGGDDLVDALVDLRSLVELEAGTAGLDPDVVDGLGKALDKIDGAFTEMLKGHPHHLGDDLLLALEELQTVASDTGHDTDFLQQAVSAVALHAMRLQLARVEAVAGAGDADVVSGQASLDLAEAAYADGDWFAVAEHIEEGVNVARDPSYAGDSCPAEIVHVHLQALCDAQGLRDDLAALVDAHPTDGDLADALGKIETAIEKQADAEVVATLKSLREAIDRLQGSSVVSEAEQEAVARFARELLVVYLGEVDEWGGAQAGDRADADASLVDGDDALALGDWLGAVTAYEDAAAVVKP